MISTAARHLPRAEKDADDPTTPPPSLSSNKQRQDATMVTSLSKLFAAQSSISPELSRPPSYIHPLRPVSSYSRSLHTAGTAPLPEHIYLRGFQEGRHSDITVHAFGQQYKLHRLILDRAPFFRSALSEPWLEANSKETTLHPEDMDGSITKFSFELALKRLYGCNNAREEEEEEAVGLFATGCWLEMQDLVDSSIASILRQMNPENLSSLVKLVTNNYYGRAGDKIIASAKSMLCRDGWKMPLRYWDGVPGDVVREIVGGDGFFIDGEWDRWLLAKKLLDRRLRLYACEAGLVESGNTGKVLKAPNSTNLMAVRFDSVYRRNTVGVGKGIPEHLQQWVSLYTHPDIEPLLVLLDEGIHYVHLDFERLQFIRNSQDILGLPVMPEKVISQALWQQMELRQKIVNASELDEELGISSKCGEEAWQPRQGQSPDKGVNVLSSSTSGNKGKEKFNDSEELSETNLDSGSWDGNGKPRKFWIPSSDCNIVMGGNAEPVVATSNNTTLQRQASRSPGAIQPEDVQWAADFAAATAQPRPFTRAGESGLDGIERLEATETRYTHFPPFRFAAEFPNPRLLKEKKRVYSRTVFYAGSLWNIYIQKVASSRSKQLGVYLHRAKEQETEEVIAGTSGLAQGSVDERIGQLEREMIMNAERHERRQRQRASAGNQGQEADDVPDGRRLDDVDARLSPDENLSRTSTISSLLSHTGNTRFAQRSATVSSGEDLLTPESNTDSEADNDVPHLPHRNLHVPTLPPYVDARPTIKTYFKIYSPSRGGRMLSVYESAPDTFNFSQSWGWKSSTLMLDEGLLGGIDEIDGPGEGTGFRAKGEGDGKLRFMVVIGNI